ncbi:MAG: bifunctional DNA-formamidopyrimidine glycosylase/DNA-(apurinic or apyrimidinic site) lyase [Chloroflexi bacterium]|nr:bifunctional DNA-formamidopyrimidine glycosylase/DNA-(apurinic or apyrimidinic site) lyase [Chloroflexota bacterium]MCA2000569.1 bifunctional DNA-formamidopyrimidine glycosylase/DNA-(apurinic or apyrimidinic site) lyase [Chloroflexota bacterium]
MPELPEVETIVRALKPQLVGRTILSADLRWARSLALPSPAQFKKQIAGQKILDLSRRAKYLVFRLESYSFLVHLRMSGDLTLRAGRIEPEKHDRLLLLLSDEKCLAFNDPRKFGRVWLTTRPETVLGGLGPEPLEKGFTPRWLFEALRRRKRSLKPLLLDQTFLAGLGNIYADECLHLAKLHPRAASNRVSEEQAQALHRAIRAVLREGIRRNGASIDWVYRGGGYQNHFRVYDREGKPCPVCGAAIQKFILGQRGTHICPNCQRLR